MIRKGMHLALAGALPSRFAAAATPLILDLQSSAEQVGVAQSNVELAAQTLEQAQDRFKAGVTDNIEVVQAQESVVSANGSYIQSVYAFNLAKISLARAVGFAEDNLRHLFKGY